MIAKRIKPLERLPFGYGFTRKLTGEYLIECHPLFLNVLLRWYFKFMVWIKYGPYPCPSELSILMQDFNALKNDFDILRHRFSQLWDWYMEKK